MKNWLISLPRSWKRILIISSDLSILWFALSAAFIIRLGPAEFLSVALAQTPFQQHSIAWLYLFVPLAVFPFLIQSNLYSTINRFNGIEVTGSIVRAITLGLGTFLIIVFLLPADPFLPRSIPIIWWALSAAIMTTSRYWIGKWLHGDSLSSLLTSIARPNRPPSRGDPVTIYGAGIAGRQLLAALKQGYQYRVVAFIDDNQELQKKIIAGVRVYNPEQIDHLMSAKGAKEILLAIPSASHQRRKQIIEKFEPFGISIKTMPSMEEIAQGKVQIASIRDISIDDILGRDPIPANPELFAPCIENKSVLVTGAGGSIGGELCRQIISAGPKRLILFENSEYNLYRIGEELKGIYQFANDTIEIISILGSVTQPQRLNDTIRKFSVQTIYHAAAYKHVPLVEHNSYEGFKNNVLGTLYAAESAILNQVESFVLISTDKAVRPGNMMGATKRISELILQAVSVEPSLTFYDAGKFGLSPETRVINRTQFTMVRFGNVLESSGSVIPKFREQIRTGGPVTVTHPDIIRYFMTIPEAAQLVIQAGSLGNGGDVFVLDMGQPIKIDELARKLIQLSGLVVKDTNTSEGDIEIEHTGLRPGEKLYEELLIGENVYTTQHPKILRAEETTINWASLTPLLEQIETAFSTKDYVTVRQLLENSSAISYLPTDDISDLLYEKTPTNHLLTSSQ